MATIKGSGNPLSHQQMDNNFIELNDARSNITALQAELDANHQAHALRIESLETHITALQAELDTNQQSAETILNGVISRLNITKTQLVTYRNEFQNTLNTLPSTGQAQLDQFFREILQQLVAEYNAAITEVESLIALYGEDFTL